MNIFTLWEQNDREKIYSLWQKTFPDQTNIHNLNLNLKTRKPLHL